jgi:two-component system, cell cycle sensor histidine kinase and response regulator CckA
MLLPIMGYADMILADLAQNHPLYEEIKNIQQAALKAKDLTRQLLAFSRKQPLEMKVLDINTVIRDFQKMLRRTIRENIEIHTELYPGPGYIKADLSQMEQVLMNLAVNAQDAMPEGGRITISTAPFFLNEADQTYVSGLAPGAYLQLTFGDSGKGMEQQTIAQIFEPFFTTKNVGQGTGLGLSLVYGIVQQHGGAITVESGVDKGTFFMIMLPIAAQEHLIDEEPPLFDKGQCGTETILIVEDDSVVRSLVEQMLKRCGYTVLTAASTVMAVEISRSHPGTIDLLLTDVVMPGMHGRQLYEMLCIERPGLKVVYMSGYTQEAIAAHGVGEPETYFVQKPFTMRAVTEKIRVALGT